MEEIKVGKYVRTTDGNIDYIDAIFEDSINLRKHKWCDDRYIAKHSPNIIDLIEVGDYVNGHKIVSEIWGEDDNDLYFEVEGGFGKATYIGEKNIKSIVTKEAFKSVMYEV